MVQQTAPMPRPRENRRTARLTVSLDERIHATLTALARRQDVSVAWLMRRAVSEFIERQEPQAQPELPLRRRGSGAAPFLFKGGEQ